MGKIFSRGALVRIVTLLVAHAPGMPGTFSPPPRFSDPNMHHGTCVTNVPWCMPGSLISGFLWSRWRGKRSRLSRRMRNPLIYVSGKGPMGSDFAQPDKHNMTGKTALHAYHYSTWLGIWRSVHYICWYIACFWVKYMIRWLWYPYT